MVEELEKIAVVHLLQHRSIISLIGNVQRSSLILEKVGSYLLTKAKFFSFYVFYELSNTFLLINFYQFPMPIVINKIYPQAFNVLRQNGVNVQMISQGASKVLCSDWVMFRFSLSIHVFLI